MSDQCQDLVDLYSLDLLQADEHASFERHLGDCAACREIVQANKNALGLAAMGANESPHIGVREWLLDFAKAPRGPIDRGACAWEEISPGVRLHNFGDDAPRAVRSQLMWVLPGAVHPTHRHMGEESILVLEGGLIVDSKDYHSGEVCRVRAGAPHSESVASREDCMCFVVHRAPVDGPIVLHGAPERRCLSCVFYPQHSAAFGLAARPSLA